MGKKRRRNARDRGPPEAKGNAEVFPTDEPDVSVDGSLQEGGGQMVRTAMGLGSALGVSVHVSRVRAGRANPGLRAQHIAGARAAATLGGGTLHGARVGSRDLLYTPDAATTVATENGTEEATGNNVETTEVTAQVGTAGATALVLQAAFPVLLVHCPGKLSVRGGGTHVPSAPSAEYVKHVFCPIAARFGLNVKYEISKRGFFPRGGASVDVSVDGTPVPWRQLKRARVVAVRGMIVCGSSTLVRVAAEMRKGARDVLRKRLGDGFEGVGNEPYEVETAEIDTQTYPGQSLCITLWATNEDGGSLGSSRTLDERAAKQLGYGSLEEAAEDVGAEVATEMVDDLMTNAAVDRYMADQIGVLMALANGESAVGVPSVSLHLRSVQEVLKQFNIAMKFVEGEDGKHQVVCGGSSKEDERNGDKHKSEQDAVA